MIIVNKEGHSGTSIGLAKENHNLKNPEVLLILSQMYPKALEPLLLEGVDMPSSRGYLPNSGIEPVTLWSPASAGGFFTTSNTGETHSEDISSGSMALSSPVLRTSKGVVSLQGEVHAEAGR